MIKHYIEYRVRKEKGATPVTYVTPIEKRDIDLVPKIEGMFCFRFFDRQEVLKEGELLKGGPTNFSPTYHLGGTFIGREQLLAASDKDDLIRRIATCIKNTNYIGVVLHDDGFTYFSDGDIIME